jgi:hypothetical protein
MAITNTWSIDDLVRGSGDKVAKVHYKLTVSDGTNIETSLGILDTDGDLTIPFADLTKANVLKWVADGLGSDNIAALESKLAGDLSIKTGVPWTS